MCRVARQQVRAQQQQAHGWLVFATMARQIAQVFADAMLHLGVVQAHLGVFDRVFRLGQSTQRLAGPLRITVHQGFDQVLNVVLRAGEPIAHGQKEQAQILCCARDEAQQFGQASQHGHLLGSGAGWRAGVLSGLFVLGTGTELFQQGHQTA